VVCPQQEGARDCVPAFTNLHRAFLHNLSRGGKEMQARGGGGAPDEKNHFLPAGNDRDILAVF